MGCMLLFSVKTLLVYYITSTLYTYTHNQIAHRIHIRALDQIITSELLDTTYDT